MKNDFSQIKYNKNTDIEFNFIKRKNSWIFIFILILIGAGLGFAVSLFKKPIYEATALVTTNLHLNEEGPINEIMLDSQINHIGDLYFHPQVVEKLIATEKTNGLSLNLETLKEIGTVERRLLNSQIKIRHSDPQIAARIATNWAKILFDTLNEAYPYAIQVSNAKDKLVWLNNCVNPIEEIEIDAFCKSITKDELDQAISDAEAIILDKINHTLGLSKYLNVSQYQPASVPNKAISYHKGSMVLAGGVIGFLVALGILMLRKNNE